jgi:hypothetical protein
MEHFRHRPQAGKTILAVYGGWKLNGFAVNSKRFFSNIERFLQRIPKTVKWFLDMMHTENIVGVSICFNQTKHNSDTRSIKSLLHLSA